MDGQSWACQHRRIWPKGIGMWLTFEKQAYQVAKSYIERGDCFASSKVKINTLLKGLKFR